MKNQLIAAAVSVGLAVTANAGSVQDSVAQASASKDGSLQALSGVLGSSKATLNIVSDGLALAADSVESAAKGSSRAADSASTAVSDATMYIFTTPSNQMSDDSSQASETAFEFIIDTSGNVYRASRAAGTYVSTTPSNQMSQDSANSTSNAVEVVVDSTGRILKTSGGYVSDNYGEPATAVRDGSGQVFVASGASIIVSGKAAAKAGRATLNASDVALTYVSETSVDVSTVTSGSAGAILDELSALPAASFNASKRGRLNDQDEK